MLTNEELERIKKTIKADLYISFYRMFNIEKKKIPWQEKKKVEKRNALKNGVYKYLDNVYIVLNKYADMICDLNVLEITDVMSSDWLYSYRIRYGIMPNSLGINITNNRVIIPSINAKLVDKAIFEAQNITRYYQVKENGPLDLNTPFTDFYFSERTYFELKELQECFDEPLELKHIIGIFLSFKNRNPLWTVCFKYSNTYKEATNIAYISGYDETFDITKVDFKVKDKVEERLKQLKQERINALNKINELTKRVEELNSMIDVEEKKLEIPKQKKHR